MQRREIYLIGLIGSIIFALADVGLGIVAATATGTEFYEVEPYATILLGLCVIIAMFVFALAFG
jgi:ABC-type antimicrobial peptide transport system permease subunit